MHAILALKDGTILKGKGFGAETKSAGEVIFNTSLVGYEEALTDPSYKGQILTMTYPLIGNYGVRKENFESDKVQAEGFIVRQNNDFYQHRLAEKSVSEFLKQYNIPGISEIDTRMITKKIREHGVINGSLITSERPIDQDQALEQAKKLDDISNIDLLSKVSIKEKRTIDNKGENTIAIIDCGIKHSIIRSFSRRKINMIWLPYNTRPDEILDLKVDGLFVSNGPGDPNNAKDAINCVKELQSELPISGICLGNQIISLALGAKIYKLKFGHHGSNQPVKDIKQNKVYISSQNHNFAVEELPESLEATYINLNDNSNEGIRHKKLPIQSVQFHPEANPGPWDCDNIFDDFVKSLK